MQFGIGDASNGTYRQTDQIQAEAVVVSAEWIVYWSGDDVGHVSRLGNRNQLANSAPIALQRPPSTDQPDVHWEDDQHLLIDLTDNPGDRALLRCDPTSGTCEVARTLGHSALVAD